MRPLPPLLKRHLPLHILILQGAIFFALALTLDLHYWGHRPIFGQWHYWSFGTRGGNLFAYRSDGDGAIYDTHDQIVEKKHAPVLGGVPYLKWNHYRFEASAPAWLPLAIALCWMVWAETRWRGRRETNHEGTKDTKTM